MKVALVVGSLEPGCDGVGDYSRMLAAELIRQGRKACVISLADRDVKVVAEGQQDALGIAVTSLRIPDSIPWERRVEVAHEFMRHAGVSHLSFQFVPYGYSPKGIVRTALPFLLRVAEGRKVHVMFHELWIGNHIGASLKDRLIGALQRRYVLRLFKMLAPLAVHTTNAAYAAFLAREGFKPEILPLFGNIPIAPDRGTDEALALFRNAGVELSESGRDAIWIAGIFGSIPPEWKPDPFFTELAAVATREKKSVRPPHSPPPVPVLTVSGAAGAKANS